MDPELKALKDKEASIAQKIKDLGARRSDWSDADRAAWKKLTKDYQDAKAASEAREKDLDLDKRIADAVNGKNGKRFNTRTDSQGRVTAAFEDTDESVTLQFSSKGGQPSLNYSQRRKLARNQLKTAGYEPWGEFKNFADFVRAGFDGHQTNAFKERHRKHFNAVQGMSEGQGAEGGFTVMPEFSSKFIDRIFGNSLFSRTDNYTVSGNNMTFLANAETSRANGSRHGGMRGYWLGEGATATSSKPTFREISMKLVKLGVVVYLTQELIDDSGMALEQYVANKAVQEFEFMLGDSLFNGTGAGQPLGILNAPSLVSVAKESGQLAATLETENIVKMYSRFYAPHLPNAIWYHNQDIQPELDTMTIGVGTGGVVTYMPPGGLADGRPATLRGLPMEATEFNATLGTQGDIILGDLSQILSISKGGVAQAVSAHVQFLADQLALRFILRVNASPWDSAPLTPYKGGSNTQSSFVALDTRS